MQHSGHHFIPYVVAVLMLTAGCATIPSEAPELSAELGSRISSIQDSHLRLLHEFFDLKREEVDRFINDEWIPLFARNVFEHERMAAEWEEIVSSGDPGKRLDFIVRVGPMMQDRINAKRRELISPLDLLERELRSSIINTYDEARAINSTLTSFLYSAAEVHENRTRYLEMLGVTDEGIGGVIDEVSRSVSMLGEYAEKEREIKEKTAEYKKKLEEILERF